MALRPLPFALLLTRLGIQSVPLAWARSKIPSIRQMRWGSGVVLWCYVALHLGNHAMGLVSLGAASALMGWLSTVWHSLPGTVLLYGAVLTHLALAGVALWRRRSLRMPWMEGLRLALGLCLPLLLAGHFVGTRWAYEALGAATPYARIVQGLMEPERLVLQSLLLMFAWGHGCLGLHMALRTRLGWQRWQPLLLTGAILWPLLAALGLLSMAREIAWEVSALPPLPAGRTPEAMATAEWLQDALRWGWLVALVALGSLRFAWQALQRWRGVAFITLHYPEESVQVPRGLTVLEASRSQGIAHLALCGGRARCSTCRVRVQGPANHVPAPGKDERSTLARVQAPHGVRLACQLRPVGDLQITPLFQPGQAALPGRLGHERPVAILFVDLRRWSGMSERQWPHDLAWMLDQYFARVGAAVQQSGGVANQFIGDSVMAIFGLQTDLPTACHQAVQAAALIEQRMEAWSETFSTQFGQPLDFGMGLHAGRVALGQVGYEDTTTFSAVGEVVNTASRLQDHSKIVGARLVLSLDAARLGGVASALGPPEQVRVRGRSQPLQVLHVKRPSQLWGKPVEA